MFKPIAFALLLTTAPCAFAKGDSRGGSHYSSHGASHSSSHVSSKSPSVSHSNTRSISVHGYTRKNGATVAPYHRSAADHTKSNNWSTKGNINPYTGRVGTKKVH